MNKTGRPQVALLSCRCPKACALHELYYVARQAPSTQPNEQIFKLDSGKVINYSRCYQWIKRMCVLTGMDPAKFATHGFRSGGTIDHLANGCDDRIIMQQAGWKSLRSLKSYADKKTGPQLLRAALRGYGIKSPLGRISIPTWKILEQGCHLASFHRVQSSRRPSAT